jgi:hypothetical protein
MISILLIEKMLIASYCSHFGKKYKRFCADNHKQAGFALCARQARLDQPGI